MIEIEIPKDIKEFEPKLIGPLTKRTLLGGIAVVVTSLVGYFIMNSFCDNGLRFITPAIFDIPWALIMFYKPYGMKFEQYFMSQLYTTIIPPKHREYKIDNLYKQFENELGPQVNRKKKGGKR